MAHHIPTAGAVLSLIGGIFVLLGGYVVAVFGVLFSLFFPRLAGLFFIGLAIGALIIVLSILLFVVPQARVAWGALIIVLAVLSWPFALGGFFLGFLLALIGGILAITHKAPVMMQPPMGQPMMPPPPGAMACPHCGGVVNWQTRTCTACGRSV
ncbi:MAG TPA: DUF6114 domain-containing protein [Thermoplasmata archaeon]